MSSFAKKIAIKKTVLVFIIACAFSVFVYFSFNVGSDLSGGEDDFVPPRAKIVAFGDSLTAGYHLDLSQSFPSYLQDNLRQKGYDVEVINQGVSGDTTSMALRRFSRVLDFKPDIVILEFGANDVLRNQSLEQAQENLIFMIEKMKDKGILVLLAGLYSPEYYGVGNGMASAFYTDIAKRTGVPLYPNFMAGIYDNATIPSDLLLPDSVHPSAQGAKVIAENITPFVERVIRAFYQQERQKANTEINTEYR